MDTRHTIVSHIHQPKNVDAIAKIQNHKHPLAVCAVCVFTRNASQKYEFLILLLNVQR